MALSMGSGNAWIDRLIDTLLCLVTDLVAGLVVYRLHYPVVYLEAELEDDLIVAVDATRPDSLSQIVRSQVSANDPESKTRPEHLAGR